MHRIFDFYRSPHTLEMAARVKGDSPVRACSNIPRPFPSDISKVPGSLVETYTMTRSFLLTVAGHVLLTAALVAQSPADREQIERYVESAVLAFERGETDRARSYLEIATGMDADITAELADSHKLRGFLYWNDGQEREAVRAFLESVRRRPDSFLWYRIGVFHFSLDSHEAARRAFTEAVRTELVRRRSNAGELNLSGPLPFACRISPRAVQHPDVHHLWNRGLADRELATAALIARILTEAKGRTSAPEDAIVTELDGALQEAASLPGVRQESSEDFVFLLLNVPDDRAHRRCLRSLEAAELTLKQKIQSADSRENRDLLERNESFVRRAHALRAAFFADARSSYGYGVYLLRRSDDRGELLRALNSLRRALSYSAADPVRGKAFDPNRIRPSFDAPDLLYEQTQILHAIGRTYDALNRQDDAATVRDLAGILESVLEIDGASHATNYTGSKRPPEAQRVNNARRKLQSRAGQSRKNREALLMLLAEARRNRNEADVRELQDRLAQRDREFDEAELLSAFRE